MICSALHCAVHSCTATTSVAHYRMPHAAILSSSDSEGDSVTASWKHDPEDSKPKQRQVGGKATVLVPMSRLSTAFLHSTFLDIEEPLKFDQPDMLDSLVLSVPPDLLLQPHAFSA